MAVMGHRSCSVHMIGLPKVVSFFISDKDKNPWFIQWRWMISAYRTSLSKTKLNKGFAIDTEKRFFFEKWLLIKMIKRSHTNLRSPRYRCIVFCSTPIISGLFEIFFFTSSFTFTPLFLRADIRRLQAIAAPPVFSDVLISKTFIKQNHDLNTKVRFFSHYFLLWKMNFSFHTFVIEVILKK